LHNGSASLKVREIGPDLVVEADVIERAFVVTSIPDWPGWRARSDGRPIPLAAVNHAFVGFWLPAGRHIVRLHYLPGSFVAGAALSLLTALALVLTKLLGRRRAIP
jgi:uncharacterized membrane protein YfhO